MFQPKTLPVTFLRGAEGGGCRSGGGYEREGKGTEREREGMGRGEGAGREEASTGRRRGCRR